MIQNTISRYVHTMFDESRDGELIVGDADNRFQYSVEWDEQTSNELAQQCSVLVGHLTELSHRFETLRNETRFLSKEELEVWDIYLRSFSEHNLDMEALQDIWEKTANDDPVSEEEWALADRYNQWFEENALTRLPVKRRNPIRLISRARRYSRLVRLDAPAIVQENEAKRLAEEFVLYHCMKQNASN